MDILGGVGLTDENLKFFAAGLAGGTLLWAALFAATRKKSQARSLAQRVGKLEMRLAAGKDFAAIARAVQIFEDNLPGISKHGWVPLFSAQNLGASPLPKSRPQNRADPEQIAREFAEAMRDNTVATVEIAKLIIDKNVNLNDPKDRRDVAARIKKFGQSLSTGFWDRHGELMLQSNLPGNLKDLLRVFFAQVKRLKTAVNDLAREPTFADLDTVLDRAIDLLDTAKSIIDELESRAGA